MLSPKKFVYDDRSFVAVRYDEVVLMNDFLVTLEQTSIATFIRESSSYLGFPTVLTMHTFGLCFIMGANVIVSARMLGVAPNLPLKPLRRLFPFMWLGLILTVLSGVGLMIAAATKRVLNPILLVKLVVIAVAIPITWALQRKVFDDPAISDETLPSNARTMAVSQLFLWVLVLIAGRLIAYSATILGEGY
jgi:hypothetical protein